MLFSTPSISTKDMGRGINLSEVVRVTKGNHSNVLMNVKLADPRCSLSIITASRSLDLTLPTHAERNLFYKNLKQLIGLEMPNNNVLFT
jgi:hypothetical protein